MARYMLNIHYVCSCILAPFHSALIKSNSLYLAVSPCLQLSPHTDGQEL